MLKVEVKSKNGNLVGYINRYPVKYFQDVPAHQLSKEAYAKHWMKEMSRFDIYPNRVSQTGAFGKWAVSIDGNFQEAFTKKMTAIFFCSKEAGHL